MTEQISGIYKITNPIGQVYIGQSRNVKSRIYSHKKTISYSKLGHSIRLYGAKNHLFEIIEECDVSLLTRQERYWQDFYEVLVPKKGLNGNLIYHPNGKEKIESEHKYWRNYDAIGYEYIDYELYHENINYLVEGVVEIMKDSKLFFLNEVKINGTNISSWMHKSKKQELNEIITNKINQL